MAYGVSMILSTRQTLEARKISNSWPQNWRTCWKEWLFPPHPLVTWGTPNDPWIIDPRSWRSTGKAGPIEPCGLSAGSRCEGNPAKGTILGDGLTGLASTRLTLVREGDLCEGIVASSAKCKVGYANFCSQDTYKSTKHQENYHPSCSQPCPSAAPTPTTLLQVVYASAKEALNKQLLETMLKLTHPDSVRCRQRVTVVVVVLGVSEKALIGKGFCEWWWWWWWGGRGGGGILGSFGSSCIVIVISAQNHWSWTAWTAGLAPKLIKKLDAGIL